jgi:hypothetical protein
MMAANRSSQRRVNRPRFRHRAHKAVLCLYCQDFIAQTLVFRGITHVIIFFRVFYAFGVPRDFWVNFHTPGYRHLVDAITRSHMLTRVSIDMYSVYSKLSTFYFAGQRGVFHRQVLGCGVSLATSHAYTGNRWWYSWYM